MKDLSQLPAHAHCRTCGKPIVLGKNYCSKECELVGTKEDRKRRSGDFISRFILVAMFAVTLLFFLFQLLKA